MNFINLRLRHDGRDRTYDAHVPDSVMAKGPTKSAPIWIGLHGGNGTPVDHNRQTRMDEAAEKFGAIAVRPAGLGKTWNDGGCCGFAFDNKIDDMGFIAKVIDLVSNNPYADPSRVYLCGMSNGARTALRFAVEQPRKIAAVCGVASTLGVAGPDPEEVLGVPMMAIHGLLDSNAPVLGGIGANAFSKVNHRAVWDVCDDWGLANSCNSPRLIGFLEDRLRFEWAGKRPVELCLLPGGGHQWPGGVDMTPNFDGDGKVIATFDANAVMWEFFSRFTR